jgi:uncharacterized protein (TIGR02266 family)
MAQDRKDTRTPITLKIKFKSASLDQFIERYSVDISRGGIFIRTKEPLSVGTPLRFEFQLQNASPLIAGEGTVVWTRDPDPTRTSVAPGMGVRFDKLTPQSQQVLDRILTEKASRDDGQAESRYEAGIQTQPQKDFNDRDAKTPLPQPVPGFGDDGDMTRVMLTDEARVLANRTRGREVESGSFDRDESTVQIDARTVQTLLAGTLSNAPIEPAAEEAPEEEPPPPPPPPRPRRQTGSQPQIPIASGSAAGSKRKTLPPEAGPAPSLAQMPAPPAPAAARAPTTPGAAQAMVPAIPPTSGGSGASAAQWDEGVTTPGASTSAAAKSAPAEAADLALAAPMHAPSAPAGLRTAGGARPASPTPQGMAATTSSAGGSATEIAAGRINDTATVVRGGQRRDDESVTVLVAEPTTRVRHSTTLATHRSNRSMVPMLMVGIAAVAGIVLYFVFSQSPPVGGAGTGPAPAPGGSPASATAGGTPVEGTTQGNPSPNPAAGATDPAAGAAGKPATPSAPGTIDMTLVSTPPGATVAIDGIVQTGVTPLPLKGLRPDKSLQLVLTLAGYKPYSARIQAKAGDFPVTLERASSTPRPGPNAPIEKYVVVNSIPVGADVLLEGKKIGKTPTRFKVSNLTKPLHLEVRRPGFHHEERTITSADTFTPKGNDDVLELSYQLVSNVVPTKKPGEQAPAPAPSPSKPPVTPKPEGQPAATATPPPAEEKPKPKEEEKPAEAKPETPPSEGAPATP